MEGIGRKRRTRALIINQMKKVGSGVGRSHSGDTTNRRQENRKDGSEAKRMGGQPRWGILAHYISDRTSVWVTATFRAGLRSPALVQRAHSTQIPQNANRVYIDVMVMFASLGVGCDIDASLRRRCRCRKSKRQQNAIQGPHEAQETARPQQANPPNANRIALVLL